MLERKSANPASWRGLAQFSKLILHLTDTDNYLPSRIVVSLTGFEVSHLYYSARKIEQITADASPDKDLRNLGKDENFALNLYIGLWQKFS